MINRGCIADSVVDRIGAFVGQHAHTAHHDQAGNIACPRLEQRILTEEKYAIAESKLLD